MDKITIREVKSFLMKNKEEIKEAWGADDPECFPDCGREFIYDEIAQYYGLKESPEEYFWNDNLDESDIYQPVTDFMIKIGREMGFSEDIIDDI